TVAEPTVPGRRVMGHGVIGAPVAEDRDPGRGGAAGELRTGLGLPNVAAEDERRTGGGGDAGGQRFEFGGGGLRFGQLGEGGGGRLGEADEDVLGQTDDDGTGPAGRGDAQRFGGELAGAVLVVDGDHAFRGRGEPLGQA